MSGLFISKRHVIVQRPHGYTSSHISKNIVSACDIEGFRPRLARCVSLQLLRRHSLCEVWTGSKRWAEGCRWNSLPGNVFDSGFCFWSALTVTFFLSSLWPNLAKTYFWFVLSGTKTVVWKRIWKYPQKCCLFPRPLNDLWHRSLERLSLDPSFLLDLFSSSGLCSHLVFVLSGNILHADCVTCTFPWILMCFYALGGCCDEKQ